MRHGWVFMGEVCLFLLTGHPVVSVLTHLYSLFLQVLQMENPFLFGYGFQCGKIGLVVFGWMYLDV